MHNDDEWGNLGDFEANDPNAARAAANRASAKNPAWLEKTTDAARRKAKDPAWRKACANGRKKFRSDTKKWAEYIEKLKQPYSEERLVAKKENMKEHVEKGTYKKSTAQVKAMAESRMSAFQTPFGVFNSLFEFRSEHPDINIRDRFRLIPHLYYSIENGPGETTYENVFYTPYGCHKYLNKLYPIAVAAGDPNTNVKHIKDWFYKMERNDPENYYRKTEPKREWELKK